MSTVIKDLGAVSAYAYAVEKGYTGTEAEFAELMADYAEVGQRAEDAAETATTKASEAATSATTATNKASEATTAAQTATTKAGEAQTSAQTASSKASEASQSASQASGYAQTAETAKTDAQAAKTQAETARDNAVTAKTAAETAQGKAEDAQAAAERVAESIPSDYSQLSEDVSDLKEDLDYIEPIVAPKKINIVLANGTISNPNNANAVRTSEKIPCKFGDIITIYPIRPNIEGYHYRYGYRIYDANGATLVNIHVESADANPIEITNANAASIDVFVMETDGTNFNALRADTYGYTPYVLIADGTSLSETVHEPENLYHKYGSDSVHYSISGQNTLTYGDAQFMAVLPCAPNTKYVIKISRAVTTHPRFRIAWSEMYPNKAGLPVYDLVSKDNDMTDIYTTGATARYILVYLGFTMATETPSQFISITGYDLHVDPYARHIIKSNSDIYRQKAEVLRLKKTGGETYGECDVKFMFMTDIHADVSRLKDAIRRCKEWGNSYISAVLNGGDTVYQKLPDGLDWYYDQIDAFDIPVLPTVGNHDAWSALSVLETDPVVVYNAIIAPIVTSTGIVQPANAATNGYNYYYKDFNNTVRLIVVDCMYWNATQLSWLESVLADAKTNGLHVIALTHCAFPWANMQTVDCSWSKAGMLNGYSSQAVLSDPSRTNIQAAQAVKDFIDEGGTFICWLTGHQHSDDVHILPNYDNQFVVTLGSFAQRASMLQKSDIVTDYNYNCLTYITVDTYLKVIKFMRIGADIDMYGVKHNFLSIKYDEAKLISAN